MSQALSSQRSWIARIAVLAMLASLMAFGAAPAGAAIDTSDACPASIPDAGFTDLGGVPAAAVDAINCIADYGISTGTTATTFSPFAEVQRWQMALFITRQVEAHGLGSALPAGTDQGFTDLGGVPAAAVTAINQIAELGISTGTSATTFDPFATVERWQMALFLARLIDIANNDNSATDDDDDNMPDGSDQGFVDLTGVPAAAVTAINQIAQLDVADGTSATTFAPFAPVERWQMALFLARTLAVDDIVPTGTIVSTTGAPDLQSVTFDTDDDDETRLLYTFDEDISSTVDDGNIWLVGWNGDLINPNAAGKSPDDDNVARAVFDNEDYDNAVRAVVTTGAVTDVDGLDNTIESKALNNVTVDSVDWPDDYPELVSAGEFDAADDTVEFEFDVDILTGSAAGDAGQFFLVEEDGTVHTGDAVTDDDGDDIIIIEYTGLSQTEFDDVVRAFVFPGVLSAETGGFANVANAVDVSQSGQSDTPYLVSVDIDYANDEATFEFDQTLEDFAGNSGNFHLVLEDGTLVTSTNEDRDDSNPDTVEVEFAANSLDETSDLAIYATVTDAAVTGFASGDDSGPDTVGFSYTFNGVTAGPNLLSSEGSVSGLDDDTFTIVFTFDQDVDDSGLTTFAIGDLVGYDEDGEEVDLSGGSISYDDEVIEIEYGPGDTGVDELLDGDVVLFAILGQTIADDFGFTGYPDSVGCNCPN